MDTIINQQRDADSTYTFTDPANGQVSYVTITAPALPAQGSFTKESDSFTEFRLPYGKKSFKAIKKAGLISMTPHRVISERVENFIGGVPFKAVTIGLPRSLGSVCYAWYGQQNKITSWTEQGDFRYWSNRLPPIEHRMLNTFPDLTSAVRSTQSSAVAAFKSGYDLLTELAEGRETLAFLASTSRTANDLLARFFSEVEPEALKRATKGGYTPKKLARHADKAMRLVGSKWMAYRYAIMPLFYSFQDVKKLVEKRGLLFQTYRQREQFTLT
eukprot:CAMPEP_0198719472 /NCGR_PEP_ID=MMETSP1471-20131121/56517_1 /TAXON_ID=41880 /ORGANISM="Pycnococcus provasolii, Strain RCC733" /LENGTH=271 /DNA_ID=CAMNT_0044480229 /DNA_START=109 /DNA_END=921 /DNA_ORIENTATION=+